MSLTHTHTHTRARARVFKHSPPIPDTPIAPPIFVCLYIFPTPRIQDLSADTCNTVPYSYWLRENKSAAEAEYDGGICANVSCRMHGRCVSLFLRLACSGQTREVRNLARTRKIITAKLKLPHYIHEGAWGERKYRSYSFSTSALDGGELSASRPGRALALGKGPSISTGWVGLRAGLDTEARGKILSRLLHQSL
jgi:hypothetical protein